MTLRGPWTAAALCAAFVMTALPAAAQDTAALMDRIERLERDIRTLNVQIARGGGGSSGSGSAASTSGAGGGDAAYARLSVRVSQIETDIRGVTGKIEELSFQVNQVSKQLEKLMTDVDFRLKQLEQGGTAGAMSRQMQGNTMQGDAMATNQPAGQVDASGAFQPAPGGAGQSEGGSQVLGTLSEQDLNNPQPDANAVLSQPAQEPAQEPAPATSEADALLAQLTGDAPAPAEQAAPAAPPAAAPAPAGVSVDGGSQPAAMQSQETASLPDGTPREKYMHAFGLLRQGKYDLASAALRNFLEQHGDDKLASNARYWLGETYYVRGAFVEAAETFLEGYQANPQGPKAPDALLKLGMSLSSLDKKNEACAAFQKLRSDYPDAPAGLKSTLQREWQKNGCV